VRRGITIPLPGVALAQQRGLIEALPDLGYTDVWSSEVDGADAFTPLVLASVWAPALRLGTAIVPAFTRGPALLAQSAAALAGLAPGRVALGVGTSSDVIVQQWNGIPFERPYQRVRDTVRFLRAALSGAKVTEAYESFEIRNFRLSAPPPTPPDLLVAALRPGMLRLAGREADGAILNWLSADDVRTVAPYVTGSAPAGADREIAARIFVIPTADAGAARAFGRQLIAAYLTVPVYRIFHEWLGRRELLGPLWTMWAAGDRRGASASVPDEVVDALIVHGEPARCREHIQRYVEAGATTPVIALLPGTGDVSEQVRALAPRN
jgi:probable F420-dependent oxidoreductase